MRIQTANAITQSFRQHRNYAVRQVNAVSAALSLAVKAAAWPYICTDICNVDTELPAAFDFRHVDGVVEIASVIWIDRDDKLLPEILATFNRIDRDALRNCGCFLKDKLRKFHWQMVFSNDRQDVHAGRGARPQHLDDFPFWINVARLPRFQSDHDLVVNCRSGT